MTRDRLTRGWMVAGLLLCGGVPAWAGPLKPIVRFSGQLGDPARALDPEIFAREKSLWVDHTAGYMVPKYLYYDTHPEYFALRLDGTRIPKTTKDSYIHLCMSNPDVLRIGTERILGWIRLQPDKQYFCVTQGDGNDWCQCAACKATDATPGNYSDRMLRFVNHIARAVRKEFPTKTLLAFAYCGTENAPVKERPEKNVWVLYCPYWGVALSAVHPLTHPSNAEALAQLESWLAVAPDNMGIYDYNIYYMPSWDAMAEKIRWYASKNIKGIWYCGQPLCFRDLFATLVAGEMMRDPNQDFEALKADYVKANYGAAAPFVAEYLALVKARLAKGYPRGIHEWAMPAGYYLDDDCIGRSIALFDKMAAAAAGDAKLLAKIANERELMVGDFLAAVNYATARGRSPAVRTLALDLCRARAYKPAKKEDLEKSLRSVLTGFAGLAVPAGADVAALAEEFFRNPDATVAKYRAPSYKTEAERTADGVRLPATAFEGGRFLRDYAWFCEKRTAMAAYAAKGPFPTSMKAEFVLAAVPSGGATLKIEGQDSDKDLPPPAAISIVLNGATVFEGACGFVKRGWSWKEFPVGRKVLKQGKNVLEIRNISPSARLDVYWFMLSEAVLSFKP